MNDSHATVVTKYFAKINNFVFTVYTLAVNNVGDGIYWPCKILQPIKVTHLGLNQPTVFSSDIYTYIPGTTFVVIIFQ